MLATPWAAEVKRQQTVASRISTGVRLGRITMTKAVVVLAWLETSAMRSDNGNGIQEPIGDSRLAVLIRHARIAALTVSVRTSSGCLCYVSTEVGELVGCGGISKPSPERSGMAFNSAAESLNTCL